MRLFGLIRALGLLTLPLAAGVPLHLGAVIREGAPPFEGARLFRIDGDGAGTLRPGERLKLWRFNEKRRLAHLVVVEVRGGSAFARVLSPQETFPLKGDVVTAREGLLSLPDPSWAWFAGLRAPGSPRNLSPKVPSLNPNEPSRRERIFFLAGDPTLSPAGRQKLKDWVAQWGLEGRWSVGIPANPKPSPALTEARIEVLRSALSAVGVHHLDSRALPEEAPGPKDVVYVMKDPW